MGMTTTFSDSTLTSMLNGAYIGLSITAPSTDGTNVTEPSEDANYSRVAAANGKFDVTSKRAKNTNYIYFPEATSRWGIIQSLCIFASDGTLRYYGSLTEPVEVTENCVPLFRPDTINITLDL